MSIDLLRVILRTDENSNADYLIHQYEARESDRSYSQVGMRGSEMTVKKNKMLAIIAWFKNDGLNNRYGYATYCVPSDLEKAKKLLKGALLVKYHELKDNVIKIERCLEKLS